MSIFSAFVHGLLGGLLLLGWAIVVFLAVSVLALPFMAWVEVSRVMLWPVLARIGTSRQPTQFGVTDLGCLVLEMSLLGAAVAPLAALPRSGPLAILLLLIAIAVILSTWRLSLQWLARTCVRDRFARAVFQLFVVPTALFFPVLFGILSFALGRTFARGNPIQVGEAVAAVSSAALLTMLSMRASRLLAAWVAASAAGEKM